ncbi:MAG: HlyD family type I secretion periplasmic adaptor subunit, partial [Pseudomonadota bacterium]
MSNLEKWEREVLDIEGRNVFETRTLKFARILLFMILAAITCFIGWAAWAEINEVTKGDGKIIPSGRTQVIQHLEGGI